MGLADGWLPLDIPDRRINLETKENMHLIQLEALSIRTRNFLTSPDDAPEFRTENL